MQGEGLGAAAAAAFLSYSHLDNENDVGQVVRLADRIAREFRALTGTSIDIYVDRLQLRWGDDWQDALATAVQGTTFLIPVVSPSYFASSACREELLSFSAQSRKARVPQLVMPILWIEVADLQTHGVDASDEAVALVAKHQWRDMTGLRLEDENSSAYRKAVHGAAKELAGRIDGFGEAAAPARTSVAAGPSGFPARTPSGATDDAVVEERSDDHEGLGFLEHIETLESELPSLLRTVEALGTETSAIGEVFTSVKIRDDATAKQRLALATRVAAKLKPKAENFARLGQAFATSVVKLDPGVLLLLDPPGIDSSPDLEFAETVVTMQRSMSEAFTGGATEFVENIREFPKTSRVFIEPARDIERGYRGMLDGQQRIDAWAERAQGLLEGAAGAD